MSIRVKAAAAAVAAALSFSPAFAELLNFSWTISPGFVATWTQPSNPTPNALLNGDFTETLVSNGTSTSGPFDAVDYFNEDTGNGGLQIIGFAQSVGYQFYTGTEAAPIFAPGRFIAPTGVVTITAATPPVPEPSTWPTTLVGFAGLGYAAFRKEPCRSRDLRIEPPPAAQRPTRRTVHVRSHQSSPPRRSSWPYRSALRSRNS